MLRRNAETARPVGWAILWAADGSVFTVTGAPECLRAADLRREAAAPDPLVDVEGAAWPVGGALVHARAVETEVARTTRVWLTRVRLPRCDRRGHRAGARRRAVGARAIPSGSRVVTCAPESRPKNHDCDVTKAEQTHPPQSTIHAREIAWSCASGCGQRAVLSRGVSQAWRAVHPDRSRRWPVKACGLDAPVRSFEP